MQISFAKVLSTVKGQSLPESPVLGQKEGVFVKEGPYPTGLVTGSTVPSQETHRPTSWDSPRAVEIS